MPCNTVQTSKIAWDNVNREILAASLRAQGFEVEETAVGLRFHRKNAYGWREQVGTYGNGVLELNNRAGVDPAALKRGYSAEVVRQATARFGWQVRQVNERKFVATRRF